jgi:hypothetical protein
VAPQVQRMRRVLREHETRSVERVWLKGRPQGELDEARLVDGITGSSAIYKTRGPRPLGGGGARRRVCMRFVMDLSGSMYTFERLDGASSESRTRNLLILPPRDQPADEESMPAVRISLQVARRGCSRSRSSSCRRSTGWRASSITLWSDTRAAGRRPSS